MSKCDKSNYFKGVLLRPVPWTYVLKDLNGEEIVGTFFEKELQKANQSLELKSNQQKR